MTKFLRQIREANGLTQADLADKVGTSQPQIKRLESGQRKLTTEWAVKLSPHLGVTPQGLLFPDAYKKGIGQRIAARRRHLGLSQGGLAEKIGMRQQGIASIESGHVERPRFLPELAGALQVSIGWLIDGQTPNDHAMKGKFANGLKAAMERAKIGATELARRTGNTKQDISRWAAGQRELRAEAAKTLAAELNTTPEQLVFNQPFRAIPYASEPQNRLTTQVFVDEIEAYMAKIGMSPSAFGHAAVGDPNFVFDIKQASRSPSLRLVQAVRDFISRPVVKPTPSLDALADELGCRTDDLENALRRILSG